MNLERSALSVLNITNELYKKGKQKGSQYKHRKIAQQWCKLHDFTLSKEQISQIREFWGSYTLKFSLAAHQKITAITRNFDARYIPDELYFSIITKEINTDGGAFDNKSYYPLLFNGCRIPGTVFHKINGNYLDAAYQLIDEDSAFDMCSEYESVIIKPSQYSWGGKNVQIINSKDLYTFREEMKRYSQTPSYIVQKLIKQHPALGAIHNSSVNTIRITTLLIKNEIITLPPTLRMGVNNNRVDNASAGGIFCGISSDNRLNEFAFSFTGEKFEKHPQGLVFSGHAIPGVDKAKEITKHLAQRFPRMRLISWDVAIDVDGEPVIIEMNPQGSTELIQFSHGPFFGEHTEDILKDVFCKKS